MPHPLPHSHHLQGQQTQRFIWLSIIAAVFTIGLKLAAWEVSGSVGLLSDALESFVNLFAALFALAMLRLAYVPPDENHPFGHSKAEFFSSGFEGTLILMAAGYIIYAAVPRLFAPQELQALDIGIVFSVISTALNFIVAKVLAKAGKRLNSVALEADSRHLMTDVWTTVGVIIGLAAVLLTGWHWLDSVIAIGVALHILFEGGKLIREAFNGLLDRALPTDEIHQIETLLQSYRSRHVHYSNLRSRGSASRRFVQVTILVPANWEVGSSHQLLDEIEAGIRKLLPGTIVYTHLEPLPGVTGNKK